MSAEVVIAGGGPAGLMAGLLFARAGVSVEVLEKHGDFLHDFRGDTVHPSTMAVLDDLGLLHAFLDRPHQRLSRAELRIAGREMVVGDLSKARCKTPFVAMMPQWEFLDFLRQAAEATGRFTLRMDAEVAAFTHANGRVSGVRLTDGQEVGARSLVLAADGRRSCVRRSGLLPLRDLGSPIDVLWFELPKREAEPGALRIAVESGAILVRVDRGHYWQCAFVIAKGEGKHLRAQGIASLRRRIEHVEPRLGCLAADLHRLDQLHLLEVSLDRLTRWHRPGLLAIGDAAHAMSPMGGIGINLAIQDAVAAANLLAAPIVAGRGIDHRLGRVQRRRYASTATIQMVQKIAQDWVLAPVLRGTAMQRPPWPLLALEAVPWLRRVPGRVIALGIGRSGSQPHSRPIPLFEANMTVV